MNQLSKKIAKLSKETRFTTSLARLQLIRSSAHKAFNWIFLPGGPGLGSESLFSLVDILTLPGQLWLLDLPGDGSNTTSNNAESFERWPLALIEAVKQFDSPILVARSTGGMYVLSLPELENLLTGLVLLDSAPDAGWQAMFAETVRNFSISSLEKLKEKHEIAPTNTTLKDLTVASAPYLFTRKGQKRGVEFLASLAYNYEICEWSEKNFDRTYQAKWIPQKMATLIMAGEEDLVTPLELFKKDQRFCRDNIAFKSIGNGGHFPWLENPREIKDAFQLYVKTLSV